MIVLYDFSSPRHKICYDGNTKIIDIKEYNNKFDQGVGDVCEDGTIIGLFVDKESLYLLLNNQITDITDKKIECKNEINGNLRNFDLRINDQEVYKTVYESCCSLDDLLCGEIEEEKDFLLYFNNILTSKESIDKFMMDILSNYEINY